MRLAKITTMVRFRLALNTSLFLALVFFIWPIQATADKSLVQLSSTSTTSTTLTVAVDEGDEQVKTDSGFLVTVVDSNTIEISILDN